MFMPMRIFTLEFNRKSLNIDHVPFLPAKKGYMFTLGKPVGHVLLILGKPMGYSRNYSGR